MKTTMVRWTMFAVCCLLGSVMTLSNSGCEGSGKDSGGGSSGGGLTIDQYNAIQSHMTYGDVIGIIGRNADNSIVQSDDGKIVTKIWIEATGNTAASIGISLDGNGQCWMKQCDGLRSSSGEAVSTQAEFYNPWSI